MGHFQLKMEMGPSPGKIIELSQKEHFLGRDDNNTIVINDAEISRRHCRLLYTDHGFEIEDLGSTNGTYVNEKRISSRYKLFLGDIIRLGDNVSLVYVALGVSVKPSELTDITPKANIKEKIENEPTSLPKPKQNSARSTTAKPEGVLPLKGIRSPSSEIKEKRKPNILAVGCVVVSVIGLCVLLGGWIYVDTYAPEYYCYFLPFLPGCP